jgi:uncharacterized membrane protein
MTPRPLRASEWLLLYLLTATVFLTFDLIWMGVVARGFYARHLGSLLRGEVNWLAAVLFYLIYIAGILIFVLLPALSQRRIVARGAVMGAAFGLVAYAAFDLSSLALIRGWPVQVAVVDMLWGSLLTGGTAATVAWLARKVV